MLTIEDFQTFETQGADEATRRECARQEANSQLRDLENMFEEVRTSEDEDRIAELREFLATN